MQEARLFISIDTACSVWEGLLISIDTACPMWEGLLISTDTAISNVERTMELLSSKFEKDSRHGVQNRRS